MARPRSVRRPAAGRRPHLVTSVPQGGAAHFPDATHRLAAARERLQGIKDEDVSPEIAEARKSVSSAIEDRVALSSRTDSEKIIANQEEILRRLSSIDSRLTAHGRRLEAAEDYLFGEEVDSVGEPDADTTPLDPPAAPEAPVDPAAPTQPLDPPAADPPAPDLPEPGPSPESPSPAPAEPPEAG